MIRDYAVIRESAERVAEAANHTIAALAQGRVEQEPAFTDRMLGAIEEAMNGFEVKGIRWRAKTLTDRGKGSQEKKYGADFMGVLDISLQDYSVRKGFLAQAKLIKPGDYMSMTEYDAMKDQCDKMLRLSPASFVFLYSSTKIRVVPALAVVGAGRRNPHELYSRSIATFYKGHFGSFIGDPRVDEPRVEALVRLDERATARSVLFLGATGL